jgi:hypothetical protein
MRNYYPNGVSPFAALQPLKEKMQEEQQKERIKSTERDRKAFLKRSRP